MYVRSPLEANTQLSKASEPSMGSLHNPPVLTQLFTAFNATPCDAAEDSPLL